MAVQKKRPSMLMQGASEAKKAEQEAALMRMNEEMNTSTPSEDGSRVGREKVQKPKTKAQRIKDKRPLQVSVHFTQDEKFAMEDARTLAKRMGIADATVEDFVHGVVVAGLRSIKDNGELLKMIISEDENLRIS